MFDYIKDHPVATVIVVGVVFFVGGAIGELADTVPKYFMWLGGGLAVAGCVVGLSNLE